MPNRIIPLGGKEALWVSLCSAAFFAWCTLPAPVLAPDSEQYLRFAEIVASGEILEPGTRELGRVTRAPLYPVLIAPFQAALGLVGVQLAHALLGAAALAAVAWQARRSVHPLIASLAVIAVSLPASEYLPIVLTEWSAYCCLLWIFAALTAYLANPLRSRAGALGAACVAGVLLKPALVPALVLPFACLALARRWREDWGCLAVSLLPLAGWMSFNLATLGSFSIACAAGYNLLGVADRLPVPQQETLSMDARLVASSAAVFRCELSERGCEIMRFNRRIENTRALAQREGWDWVRANRALSEYSLAAIVQSPAEYAAHVLGELPYILTIPPWPVSLALVLALAIAAVAIRKGESTAPAWALWLFAGLHLLHCLLCCSIELLLPRYHDLTFYPLALSALGFAGARISPSRTQAPLATVAMESRSEERK